MQDFSGHASGQIDQRVIIENLDLTDIATVQPGFVSDGADDIAWLDAMLAADLESKSLHGHVRRIAQRTCFGARSRRARLGGALLLTPAFATPLLAASALRPGLPLRQQERLAALREAGQRCSDLQRFGFMPLLEFADQALVELQIIGS